MPPWCCAVECAACESVSIRGTGSYHQAATFDGLYRRAAIHTDHGHEQVWLRDANSSLHLLAFRHVPAAQYSLGIRPNRAHWWLMIQPTLVIEDIQQRFGPRRSTPGHFPSAEELDAVDYAVATHPLNYSVDACHPNASTGWWHLTGALFSDEQLQTPTTFNITCVPRLRSLPPSLPPSHPPLQPPSHPPSLPHLRANTKLPLVLLALVVLSLLLCAGSARVATGALTTRQGKGMHRLVAFPSIELEAPNSFAMESGSGTPLSKKESGDGAPLQRKAAETRMLCSVHGTTTGCTSHSQCTMTS